MLSRKACTLIQILTVSSLFAMISCNKHSSVEDDKIPIASNGGGDIPAAPNMPPKLFEMLTDDEMSSIITNLSPNATSQAIAEKFIDKIEKKNAGIPLSKDEICETLIKKIREEKTKNEIQAKGIKLKELEKNIKEKAQDTFFTTGGGLKNLSGNDCFMNAMLQTAIRTNLLDPSREITDPDLTTEQKDEFKEAYKRVADNLRVKEPVDNEDLAIIRNTLTIIDSEEFRNGRQADSGEALTHLLDFMKNNNTSFKEKNNTKCSNCNNTSSSESENSDRLILAISGKKTMQDILDEHFKAESLTGDNKYECDTCKTKQDATRKLILASTPKTIIINLNRFKTVSTSGDFKKTKIDDEIENIDKIIIKQDYQDDGSNDSTYNLKSAIIHNGGTEGGHYYSLVKNADGKWTEYNDASVYNNADENKLKHGYIFVYEKE